jgi:hypothetical protein
MTSHRSQAISGGREKSMRLSTRWNPFEVRGSSGPNASGASVHMTPAWPQFGHRNIVTAIISDVIAAYVSLSDDGRNGRCRTDRMVFHRDR